MGWDEMRWDGMGWDADGQEGRQAGRKEGRERWTVARDGVRVDGMGCGWDADGVR